MGKIKKILIFDYDRNFLFSLSGLFKRDNYFVSCVDSMDRCNKFFKENEVSLFICGEDAHNEISLNFLKRIRNKNFFIKTFLLCNRNTFKDKVTLLSFVDDVFLKPINFRELSIKVKNILTMERISDSGYMENNSFCLKDDFFFDKDKSIFRPKELKILECLLKHHEIVVSTSTISSYVWGFGYQPLKKTISVYIRRIRTKLPEGISINTIKGRGYKLIILN